MVQIDITKHNLSQIRDFKELLEFQVAMGVPKLQMSLKPNVPETQVILPCSDQWQLLLQILSFSSFLILTKCSDEVWPFLKVNFP